MKATMHGFFLLIFSIFQATWLDYIEIWGIKPNLFLVYVIVISCFCDRIEGAVIGFVFGLAFDVLIGRIWGVNALLGMILGFCLANFCKRVLSGSNFFITLAIVLAGSILHEAVYCFIVFLKAENSTFFSLLIETILPECGYNLLISAPLYFLIKRFAKLLYTDKGDAIG